MIRTTKLFAAVTAVAVLLLLSNVQSLVWAGALLFLASAVWYADRATKYDTHEINGVRKD